MLTRDLEAKRLGSIKSSLGSVSDKAVFQAVSGLGGRKGCSASNPGWRVGWHFSDVPTYEPSGFLSGLPTNLEPALLRYNRVRHTPNGVSHLGQAAVGTV